MKDLILFSCFVAQECDAFVLTKTSVFFLSALEYVMSINIQLILLFSYLFVYHFICAVDP